MIRKLRRALLFLVGAAGLLLFAAVLILRAGADTALANSLLRTAIPGATLWVGDVAGSYVSSLVLRNLRLTRSDGATPIECDTVFVHYDLPQLLSGNVVVHRIRLVRPHLILQQTARGSWNPLPSSPRKPAASRPSGSRTRAITIERFSVVGGTASIRSRHQDSLAVGFSAQGALIKGRLVLDSLRLQSDSSLVLASGGVVLPPAGKKLELRHANIQLKPSRLALSDLRPFLSDSMLSGSAELRGGLRGDGSTAAVTLNSRVEKLDLGRLVRTPSLVRNVDARVTVDISGERLDHLNGRAEVEMMDSTRTLRAQAELEGSRTRLDVRAGLGLASVRIGGWIEPFTSVPAYDLTANWTPSRRAGSRSKSGLDPLGRQLTLIVKGRGLPPHDAIGRATLRVGPERYRALLDSAAAVVRVDRRSARLRVDAGVGRGTVGLSGIASWGSPFRLRIDRGTVEGVDLASVLGDSAWQRLDGSFSLDLRSRGDGIQLSTDARVNGADLTLSAKGRTTGLEPEVSLQELVVRHFDLARFRLSSRTTDLSGRAELQARGRRLKDAFVAGSVHLTDSRVGDARVNQVKVTTQLERGALTAEGRIDAPAGALDFAGTARLFDRVPSYHLQELKFTDVDLGPLLGLSTRLSGTLSSEGKGRRPQEAEISGRLELDRSVLDRVLISGGRVEATLADGRLEAVGNVRGRQDSLLLGALVSPFDARPEVKLVTRVPLGELAALLLRDSTTDAAGSAYVAVAGRLGRLDSMRLQGEIQADGRLGGVRLDSLGARVRLHDGVLHLDSLSLRSNLGAAVATSRVGVFGQGRAAPVRMRLGVRLKDLAPLAPLLDVAALDLDSGTVRAGADGTRDSLRLAMAVTAGALTGAGRRIERLVAGGAVKLVRGRLSLDSGDVSLQGVRTEKTLVQSVLVQGRSRSGELTIRGESQLGTRRGARVVARLRPHANTPQLLLDTLIANLDRRSWSLQHPVSISYGERIQVDDFVLAAGSHRIAIDGTVDPRGQQRFNVAVDSLPLQELSRLLLGQRELEGQLNGKVDLSGPAAAPRLVAEWDLSTRSQRRAVGSARGRVEWTAEGMDLRARVAPAEGDSLMLQGKVPVALSLATGSRTVSRIPGGTLSLDAAGAGIDISKFQPLFNPEKLGELGGRLSLNAHARGSLEAPQLSGDVVVQKAQARISPLAKYRDGLIRLRLEGQEARIAEAHFRSGQGRVDLTGGLGLQAFPRVALDLTGKAQKFEAIADDQLRASISGEVHLDGDPKTPRLSGAVRLHDTDFYLQAKNLESSAEPVELSAEDLRVLERRFGPEIANRSSQPRGLLAEWGLGVDLSLGENVWLRRRSDPVMAVELAGRLQVKKEPGQEIHVFGQIQPIVGRSFVQLMSRRFDLKTGDVTLNGPLKQARLGLEAEYRTTQSGGSTPVIITAAVNSDTGKLAVKLGSRPVMRDADIVSYLTTGRPASTDPTLASDEQGVLTTGASLAFGAALGSVAGRAGQSLGLDVVQVLQDRQGGQTVVAGKYVSPPLYLGFRQPIVPPSNTTRSTSTQQNAVELEVEYAALREMLLNLQAGGSDLRVFLKLRR